MALLALLATGCWRSFTPGEAEADLGGGELGFPDSGAPDLGAADLGAPDYGTPDTCTPGWRLGEPCARDFDCDDRCICDGAERCVAAHCEAATVAACPASVPCATATCDDVRGCGWSLDPSVCDDHEFCNGVEICVPEYGCRRGVTPTCDDANDCTYDSCTPGIGCVHGARDDDGDGFVLGACGGTDCNDMNPAVHPGAAEICDSLDDDCSGDWDYDLPMCTTPYDTCASASYVDAPGEYQGTTIGNGDDYLLSCGPGGVDVVYRLHVDATRIVELANLAVGSHVASSSMPVAIAVRPWLDCAAGPDTRCAVGPTWSGGDVHPTADMPILLTPGDYAVLLEHPTPCAYVFRVIW